MREINTVCVCAIESFCVGYGALLWGWGVVRSSGGVYTVGGKALVTAVERAG